MKQNQKATGSKTMAIKSKAYNQIKRFFHEKDDLSKFSNADKREAIEKIITDTREELWKYKQKRQKKAKVEAIRQQKKVTDFVKEHPEFEAIQKSDVFNGQFPTFALMANDLLKHNKTKV